MESSQVSSSGTPHPHRVRKILSLDGGGVRGLSTIMILKHIMRTLSRVRSPAVEPWQEFDMICGTSTGGLIAIMLGRLKMSLKDAEQQYLLFSKEIFEPRHGTCNPQRAIDIYKVKGKFDAEPLTKRIRSLVGKITNSEETLLADPENQCKVFVSAVRAGNTSATVIRSYNDTFAQDDLYDDCRIWQAARATSAASTFFDPIKIGPYNQTFVDGALKHNNPIYQADIESQRLWPDAERIIISIGTGSAPGQSLDGNVINLVKILKEIVVEAEERSNVFIQGHPEMVQKQQLFRFNVYHGLSEVGLQEYKAISKIADATQTYLSVPDVEGKVMQCVQSLKKGSDKREESGQQKHIIQHSTTVFIAICSMCLRGQSANSTMILCRTCEQMICCRCHPLHSAAHLNNQVKTQCVIWCDTMQTFQPSRPCSRCSREIRCRVECKECEQTLCFECNQWGNLRQSWYDDHGKRSPLHNTFRIILPPNATVPASVRRDCHCVEDMAVIQHCTRCLDVLHNGDSWYICIECRKTYSATAWLCKKCRELQAADHPGHQFQKVTMVKDISGSSTSRDVEADFALAWQCWDCKRTISPFHIADHYCLKMSYKVTTAMMEVFRIRYAAKCIRSSISPRSLAQSVKPPFICANENCKNNILCDSWNFICNTCPRLTCQQCIISPPAPQHQHNRQLCRVKIDSRFNSRRRARVCKNCQTSFSKDFAGLECLNCREWCWCWPCFTRQKNRKIPDHALCNGRCAVLDMIILKDPPPAAGTGGPSTKAGDQSPGIFKGILSVGALTLGGLAIDKLLTDK